MGRVAEGKFAETICVEHCEFSKDFSKLGTIGNSPRRRLFAYVDPKHGKVVFIPDEVMMRYKKKHPGPEK